MEKLEQEITDPELKKIFGDKVAYEADQYDHKVGDFFYVPIPEGRSCGTCTLVGLSIMCRDCIRR